MLLKRLYKRGADGAVLDPTPIGVKILRAGKAQNFSPDLLETGIKQGWIERGADTITIKAENGTLEYRITARPGYHCCYCAAPMADGEAAREHIGKVHKDPAHPDAKSPDPQHPAGYRRIHHFECVRTGAPAAKAKGVKHG